jgi:hypothetical protein
MIGPRLPLPADPSALAAKPEDCISKEAPLFNPISGAFRLHRSALT